MKHVHLTWYLLVDGTHADPDDVSPDDDGVLRHKNGLAVALHENGTPMTIGVGAVENKNVAAAEAGKAPIEEAALITDPPAPERTPAAPEVVTDPETPAPKAKDLKPPTPRKGYKTRESKAR